MACSGAFWTVVAAVPCLLAVTNTESHQKLQTVDVTVERVGAMVTRIAHQHLTGCHTMVLSSIQNSFLFTAILRGLTGQAFGSGVVVMAGAVEQDLEKGLWGDATTTCRAIVLHADHTNTSSRILRLLEGAGLWKLPETKVVMLGEGSERNAPLLHPSLRNTINIIYLATRPTPQLHDTTRLATVTTFGLIEERVLMYRRCLYCKGGQTGTEFLFSWNLSHVDDSHLHLYPHALNDPLKDMQRHAFKVATVPYFPYIDYERHTQQRGTTVTPKDSLNIRILYALADTLSFTYDMREDPSRSFGNLESDGRYSGMMGQLQREDADFCTILAPTPGRLKVVDYLRLSPSDYFVITSLKPGVLPASLALIRPFSREVWLGVAVSVVVWSVCLWLVQKLWSWGTGQPGVSLATALEYGWGALLEHQPKDPSVNLSGQMLVGLWLVVCLVLYTGYESSLISHLSVQSKSRTLDSLSDLVEEDGWSWGTEPWAYNGATLEYFSRHTDPVVKQIHKNMEVLTVDKAMERVLAGRFSFIIVKNYILAIISSNYTDAYGQTPFYVSKKEFTALLCYGWGLRMGAPFQSQFRSIHARLEDAGLISYWTQTVMAARVRANREAAKSNTTALRQYEVKDNNGRLALNLDHLQGAFYMLAMGTGLAILALFGERFGFIV